MNYDKNKNDAKKNFIIALVLLPFGLVLSGFVIKYGWNNILSTMMAYHLSIYRKL